MSWSGWFAIAIGGLLGFGIAIVGILVIIDIINERRAHRRREKRGNRTADRGIRQGSV